MDSIIYPEYIAWEVDVSSLGDSLSCFGKNTAKKIAKSLSLLQSAGFEYRVETVNDSYIKKFFPLYESNILQKDNPRVFDIGADIEKKRSENFPIEALSLYQADIYCGGVIYRILEQSISIMYRVFRKDLDIKIPINPSITADALLYQKAIELKKSLVYHGRDRNLYGLHSSIGLVLFKLQAGCQPFVSKKENLLFYSRNKYDFTAETVKLAETPPLEFHHILQQDFRLSEDAVLVFLGDKRGESITKAILYLKEKRSDLLEKYSLLFDNPYFSTEIVEMNAIR